MPSPTPIVTCLWFDHQAEPAANFYASIFEDSAIGPIQRYTDAGTEIHGQPEDAVMTVPFELNGHSFVALNGGPAFTFNESMSLQIHCQTQAELDHYWQHLTQGGDPEAQQCGWLKDKFGVSWQVTPVELLEHLTQPDVERARRVTETMLAMKKLNLRPLRAAFEGVGEDAIFEMTRSISAPLERVWQAWTSPDSLSRWWGPKGNPALHVELDATPSGSFFYGLKTNNDPMWGRWDFETLVPQRRISAVQAFCDEHGEGPLRHPFEPNWPLKTHISVEFAPTSKGTDITLRWSPRDATEREVQGFVELHPASLQGWSGTLDQLENELKG